MKLENQRVAFPHPEQAIIENFDIDATLSSDEILLRTQYSLISPGTELALYTNRRDVSTGKAYSYPIYPGYAAMGVVDAVGSGVENISPGDRLITLTGHSSLAKFVPSDSMFLRLPEDLRDDHAPFIRMALISLYTLRRADILPGEWLGVVGLGLVGNLGAQFGRHAGLRIISIGRSTLRSDIANECDINQILTGETQEIATATRDITNGMGCKLVLDTSGTADGLLSAIALAGDGATISLVGVPWVTDPNIPATEIMQPVFSRYLTIEGGWEWGLPLRQQGANTPLEMLRHRHSVDANANYALELIGGGNIHIEPMITHRITPESIQDVYQGLLHHRNKYLGVLIDWSTHKYSVKPDKGV